MRFRAYTVVLLVSAVLALGASGCSSSPGSLGSLPSTAASAPTNIGHQVVLDAPEVPTGAQATILPGVKLPGTSGVTALSATYQLSPSGQLPVATTVTLPLSRSVPAGDEILVATKEKTSDPWSFLLGQLTADHRAVTFQTDHFSIFGDIGISIPVLASAFKTDFLDVIDSGMSASFPAPSCAGYDTATSAGFSISSTSGSQVRWCFGMSGSQRILKVVNNSQYPMELAHPDLSVASQGFVDNFQNVLNNYGGSYTILQPGSQVTYNVNVPGNTIGGVQTAADLFGEDMYALDVGLASLAKIVTVFGLEEAGAIELFDKVVTGASCLAALPHGPAAVLTGCFNAPELAEVFGDTVGVVLSLVVAYTSVVQFFRSEVDVARDMLTGKDNYTIAITHKAAASGAGSGPSSGPTAASQPSAAASSSNGQLVVQLADFPRGTTYYFCHSGSGYPTGGSIASNGSVDVTSPNENLGALCSGSGNFWIGFQATNGQSYYSNQVTLEGTTQTSPPPPSTAYQAGLQVTIASQATGGVSGHTGPANSYSTGPTHPANSPISIVCYVNGQSIQGPYDTTPFWDLGDDGYYYTDAWLYTGTNGPAVRPCALRTVSVASQATGGVSGHTGPSNSYATGPTHPANAPVTIACYVNGQSIQGPYDTTPIWDLGTDGYYYTDAWLYTGTNGPAVPAC
jgi:hypothetical protein